MAKLPRIVGAPSSKQGTLPRTFGSHTGTRKNLPVQPTSTIPPRERFETPPPAHKTVGP